MILSPAAWLKGCALSDAAPILTLTLNPALDIASDVAAIIPGEKLRCSEPMLDPA